MTERGRIEHQFLVYGAVVVLFIEVKKELLTGKAKLDQVAQVLAEADGTCTLCHSIMTLLLTGFAQLVITAIRPPAYGSRFLGSSVMAGILSSSCTTLARASFRCLYKYKGYSNIRSVILISYAPSSEVWYISSSHHQRFIN